MAKYLHIVGLDEDIKYDLIEKYKYNINIIDLDEVQWEVINMEAIKIYKKEIDKLNSELYFLKMNGSQKLEDEEKKQNITYERNKLYGNIRDLWVARFDDNLYKKLKKINNDNLTILFGIHFNPKNFKSFSKLELFIDISKNNNNILFKTTVDEYTKKVITNNIDNFKNEIINGKYSIKLLDYNYISEKYNQMYEFYNKKKYKELDLDEIMEKINKLK